LGTKAWVVLPQVHGRFEGDVKGTEEGFFVNGKKIATYACMDAAQVRLPWVSGLSPLEKTLT
jgi:hypothetical protein